MNKDFEKYFGNLTEQEFQNNPVLAFTSEEGKPCILIRNSKDKTVTKESVTDNLEYRVNTIICRGDKNYYFHLIICKNDEDFAVEQFETAYKYLFQKIKNPQEDIELLKLISSLEELFKITPDKDKTLLHIGVYGELVFLQFLYNNGYKKILEKYHSNFFSKHDIEVDSRKRIEIKTTTKEARIHMFKHEQICRKDIDVYVGSVLLERSEQGKSLYDLFVETMALINNPEDKLDLAKLKGLCGVSVNHKGPSFSYERALRNIKIMRANDLPHLEIEKFDGVSNISYNVECSLADEVTISDFITEISVQ